jgi:DNA-binding SARP family transcriptional activator
MPTHSPPPTDKISAQLDLECTSPGLLLATGQRIVLERRDAALLAYLAMEGEASRAKLLALLWPDADAAVLRNRLRQRLFALKRKLGADVVTGGDVLRLGAHIGIARAGDGEASGRLLGDEDYADCPEFAKWLGGMRQRQSAQQRERLAERAGLLEREGRLAEAIVAAEELLMLEPLQEHAHRRLMRLHYLRGDRAAALLAFDRCEQVLKDEVGAVPSGETLALLSTIEQGLATTQAPVRRAVPASVMRPPRMVGRDRELKRLEQAWEAGHVAAVIGEAGMGKSRLLQDFMLRYDGIVRVAGRPGDAGVPLSTLARLLRSALASAAVANEPLAPEVRRELSRVLPELADAAAAPADSQRSELLLAIGPWLRASRIDGLVVDDLHFADEASLELLQSLATRADGAASLRWAFAFRPAEAGTAVHALQSVLTEAAQLVPVRLQPLDEAALAELVDGLGLPGVHGAALAPMLFRRTGGNPLFVLETLKQAWVDHSLEQLASGASLPRPLSLNQLIDSRVARLSRGAMALARLASVAGADFSIGLAEHVLGLSAVQFADELNELEAAHVLKDAQFAHDLVFDAVHRSVPEVIARHMHGQVAGWLEQRAGAPASIASHWFAAGEPSRALPFLHRAGVVAMGQRLFTEAASAFEREARLRLELGDAPGAFEAARSMRTACFELDLGSRTDAALELMDLAASSPRERASACAERALVCMHRGAMAETEQAVNNGLQALGPHVDDGLRADLLQHLAAVRIWQQRPHEAHELLRSIEHHVEVSGDDNRRVEFAQAFAIVLDHLDRPSEAVDWHRRAADAALAAGQLPRAAQTLLNLGLSWRDSGRLDRALASLHEAQAVLASLPEGTIPYSSLDLNLGIVLRDLGRYREALQWLDLAVERGQHHVPGWAPLFLANRAQLWLALGQFSRAKQDLDVVAVGATPPLALLRHDLVLAQWLRAMAQASTPALERAEALLTPGGRVLSRHRVVLERCVAMEPAEALLAANGVLETSLSSQLGGVMTVARTRACKAAFALGRLAEAESLARALAQVTDRDGTDDMYRGEAWLTAYHALKAPDPRRAEALLAAAVAWLHDTARDQVPEVFRDGFLHRNPVNRELLALAAQQRLVSG